MDVSQIELYFSALKNTNIPFHTRTGYCIERTREEVDGRMNADNYISYTSRT